MPPVPLDYTRAVIYKIVCRDVSVTETYVGSTTNLRQRRWSHKSYCNNPNCRQYNYFVYQFIRDHGGFGNWNVILVENVVDCFDGPTLHARERYWFEKLHAELNKHVPTQTQNELNKDKKAEYDRQYHEHNKDIISEKKRERRALKKLNTLGSMT